MSETNPNQHAAELLNEYWSESEHSRNERAIDCGMNVEILGTKMALGNGPAKYLVEEGGLVMMKVMHSSDLSIDGWQHDEAGYRVWFRYIDSKERERTITEEVYTI
jgi:hypothetical protein